MSGLLKLWRQYSYSNRLLPLFFSLEKASLHLCCDPIVIPTPPLGMFLRATSFRVFLGKEHPYCRGELTLLRILYNFSEYFVFTQLNGLNPYQFQERNEQIASEYLSCIRAHPALKDLPVQTTTLFGSPAKILVQHPLLEQSDLIVMCCHANAGWRRVFSGSV